MRKVIDYIRSCFCKHDWELLGENRIFECGNKPVEIEWIYRCKKCCYFKKYVTK